MESKAIAGVRIDTCKKADARHRIRAFLKEKNGARVFTPNSLILHKASRDSRLRKLLNSAELLLPDGAGVCLAYRLRGYGDCERITGIDTAEWILRFAEKNGLSVFLLGAERGVAERAAARLKKALPKLRIAGTQHGYFDKRFGSDENRAVVSKIRLSGADIIFVCMGFPTQEAWIYQNASSIPEARLFMGLGGSLDVWSGKVRRAPRLFRVAGLEWLWRAIREPRRASELLSLPLFLIAKK
ncbi:MAG: WecB/TagA/CpsF family glycosyltransferase [Ruminococcaceae bacterium]|nr:WecB/TagA/CpsF family glycosyltransferase [Oscillospiraceae bacterium]